MNDHLIRILSADGSLRATAAVTTRLVEEIRRRQGTDPTATVALGRLVSGAALMSSLLKDDQRLGLMIEGNGPLQKLHAETDAAGHVRGSVKVPVAGLPLREGTFDVAGAIGRAGFLHVVKDLGLKEPYRGMVQLYRSTVAQDLAYYFTTSEQVPSTVALGAFVEPDGRVSAAGGFMVQALPGGDEALLTRLEERLTTLPPHHRPAAGGAGPLADPRASFCRDSLCRQGDHRSRFSLRLQSRSDPAHAGLSGQRGAPGADCPGGGDDGDLRILQGDLCVRPGGVKGAGGVALPSYRPFLSKTG